MLKYNNFQKKDGISKIFIIIGYSLLFITLIFLFELPGVVRWNLKKDNYTKNYVYSVQGDLYYIADGKINHLEKLYDFSDDELDIEIPDGESIVVFVDNNNVSEGYLYGSYKRSGEMETNLFGYFVLILYLLALSLCPIIAIHEYKKNRTTLNPVFLLGLSLLIVGIYLLVNFVIDTINRNDIINQNNLANATINSQIYLADTYKIENFTYVATYKVDGQTYYAEVKRSSDINPEEIIGDNVQVLYDQNDPSKYILKNSSPNYSNLFISIISIILGFIITFFRKNVSKRNVTNDEKSEENAEWKIR